VRRRLPGLGGVACLAGVGEGVVLWELDALSILGVTTDALFARARELCWLAAVAPEALHAIFGSGQPLICGGTCVCAGELPPRMLDTSVAPRALGMTHPARLRPCATVRGPRRGLELGRMAGHTTERAVVAIAPVNSARSVVMTRDEQRRGQRQSKLKIALHGTSSPSAGKWVRAFGPARAGRKRRHRPARGDAALQSPPAASANLVARGGSWCAAR
jgi:hypothetical protein